jgi:pyridoxamine 5'-phosphate oxidase
MGLRRKSLVSRRQEAAIDTLTGDIALDLPEFDSPPDDPLGLLSRWLGEARENGVREPWALALATADADGRPSSRIVLLKEVEPALIFTSHYGSRKGRDLVASPWVSGTLYWRETLQQVVIDGLAEQATAAESDALFAERPRAAQAATIASEQSEELRDPEALRKATEMILSSKAPLSRPPGWGGYRIAPERIEFWHGRPDRLHRRLLYAKAEAGWTHRRIQP